MSSRMLARRPWTHTSWSRAWSSHIVLTRGLMVVDLQAAQGPRTPATSTSTEAQIEVSSRSFRRLIEAEPQETASSHRKLPSWPPPFLTPLMKATLLYRIHFLQYVFSIITIDRLFTLLIFVFIWFFTIIWFFTVNILKMVSWSWSCHYWDWALSSSFS